MSCSDFQVWTGQVRTGNAKTDQVWVGFRTGHVKNFLLFLFWPKLFIFDPYKFWDISFSEQKWTLDMEFDSVVGKTCYTIFLTLFFPYFGPETFWTNVFGIAELLFYRSLKSPFLTSSLFFSFFPHLGSPTYLRLAYTILNFLITEGNHINNAVAFYWDSICVIMVYGIVFHFRGNMFIALWWVED